MATWAWTLAVALLLGPGPGEVSPPAPSIEGPVEGPTPASEEPGIEFAPAPPEEEAEAELDEATVVTEEPSWPTPGTAPSDGWGSIVAGAILMPTTVLATLVLMNQARRRLDRVGVLIGGIGLELISVGFIATGIYRRAKLKRWTLAYRVVARPQGAGSLVAGGLAGAFGLTLIGVGSVALKRGYTPMGASMLGVGIAGVAVIAPLSIHIGRQRRKQYEDIGGWYRPPLPTVRLAPRLIISDTTFGLGVAGQF